MTREDAVDRSVFGHTPDEKLRVRAFAVQIYALLLGLMSIPVGWALPMTAAVILCIAALIYFAAFAVTLVLNFRR